MWTYVRVICVLHVCVGASSPPRPPYGHLETLISALCVRDRAAALSVCVCVFSRA